jgi:DNA-binding MarR family transcriptional regulator
MTQERIRQESTGAPAPVAQRTPDQASRELNELFSATFDSVLRIEEHALDNRLTAGLTISELHTIAAVGMYDCKPMKAIALHLHVTLATVTTAINKLERKGFVERHRNQADRRQVLVNLTTKGRKACRAHDMFHEKMVARALGSMTNEETNALMTALSHLVDFFNEEAAVATSALRRQGQAKASSA